MPVPKKNPKPRALPWYAWAIVGVGFLFAPFNDFLSNYYRLVWAIPFADVADMWTAVVIAWISIYFYFAAHFVLAAAKGKWSWLKLAAMFGAGTSAWTCLVKSFGKDGEGILEHRQDGTVLYTNQWVESFGKSVIWDVPTNALFSILCVWVFRGLWHVINRYIAKRSRRTPVKSRSPGKKK